MPAGSLTIPFRQHTSVDLQSFLSSHSTGVVAHAARSPQLHCPLLMQHTSFVHAPLVTPGHAILPPVATKGAQPAPVSAPVSAPESPFAASLVASLPPPSGPPPSPLTLPPSTKTQTLSTHVRPDRQTPFLHGPPRSPGAMPPSLPGSSPTHATQTRTLATRLGRTRSRMGRRVSLSRSGHDSLEHAGNAAKWPAAALRAACLPPRAKRAARP